MRSPPGGRKRSFIAGHVSLWVSRVLTCLAELCNLLNNVLLHFVSSICRRCFIHLMYGPNSGRKHGYLTHIRTGAHPPPRRKHTCHSELQTLSNLISWRHVQLFLLGAYHQISRPALFGPPVHNAACSYSRSGDIKISRVTYFMTSIHHRTSVQAYCTRCCVVVWPK